MNDLDAIKQRLEGLSGKWAADIRWLIGVVAYGVADVERAVEDWKKGRSL